MNPLKSRAVHWVLSIAALGFLVVLALLPVTYHATRLAAVVMAFLVWFGFIALTWKQRPLRWILLGVTLLTAGFLALPARVNSPEILRREYLSALTRYENAPYLWGGESARGIDCSGLIRRGLIDASWQRGLRTIDAGLVKQAINLWWHDCSAEALGKNHRGLTVPILDTPSLNALDHSAILPGDLAVTDYGTHILAYLGDHRWIEADPAAHRVITVTAPSATSAWFHGPMKIVRWSSLR